MGKRNNVIRTGFPQSVLQGSRLLIKMARFWSGFSVRGAHGVVHGFSVRGALKEITHCRMPSGGGTS